jgi:3-oxocholest-4-en-26-oate---CoA ligase
VEPGSDDEGLLAIGGRNPLGYYKDEAKSAATFKVIDGVRYSIPGDHARVRADGTIHLLGRGSVCINTAGEKVFPEEVEEAIKTHPSVRDAVVVGVPSERYGEEVVAAVELGDAVPGDADDHPGASVSGGSAVIAEPITEQQLIDHVKARVAHYKAPRRVRFVDTIGRAPNGKVDYRRHHQEAADWVSGPAPRKPGSPRRAT